VFGGAWLKDWLADVSTDTREVVAHYRHVCDDALYKSTFTLLYTDVAKTNKHYLGLNYGSSKLAD